MHLVELHAADGIDSGLYCRLLCLHRLDSVRVCRLVTLLCDAEDGWYPSGLRGGEGDAAGLLALVGSKDVFEDAEVGASVKLVGAVTVAAATLDAVEACLVFLRDLYC